MTEDPSRSKPPSPIAEQLQRAYAAEEDRRRYRLGKLLAGAARENLVLVMMSNRGYSDLFDNWVRSCDLNGLDVQSWSVLFAADEDAAANGARQGFRTYLDTASYGTQPRDAMKVFGNSDFRKLMFQKTAIVHDVLCLGYDVLFQDVDMVWRKDPVPYLLDEAAVDFDARFMYDGRNALHAPLHANTGFFLLRNRPVVRTFWAKALAGYAEMARCGSQQAVVNAMLAKDAMRVDILPESDFANGHLFSIDKPSRLPADPYVIHCSWTANHEHKLAKYRREGLWYL